MVSDISLSAASHFNKTLMTAAEAVKINRWVSGDAKFPNLINKYEPVCKEAALLKIRGIRRREKKIPLCSLLPHFWLQVSNEPRQAPEEAEMMQRWLN